MKKVIVIFGVAFIFAVMPRIVLAATLYASPLSGNFAVGSTFTVSIRTNTEGASVNTAEASISYSTDILDLISVRQGATFYLAAPGSPSKGSVSTAYFAGGLPTPGYNGTSGIVGTMTFRAKALGTGTIAVNSGKVLLNDGNGTDVFTSSSGGQYTITQQPAGAAGAVIVTSGTHPVLDNWYNKSDVTLSWDRPAGVFGYSFILDQAPDTVPDNILDTTVTTTKSYAGLKDGVWYFHIKPRGQSPSSPFGPTTHYKIQVDTALPLAFDLKLVGQSERTPTIIFADKDETSGIDHYEVYLDGVLVQAKAESPYSFNQIDAGSHVIRVIAADQAGNEQKSELPITIQGPAAAGFFERTLQIPIYILLAVILIVLVLFAVLIWLLLKRKRRKTRVEDEVADIQDEIDTGFEKLKRRINEKLLALTAKSNKEMFDSEEKMSKDIAASVNRTRESVDKKIGKLSKKISKQNDKVLE